MSFTCTTGNYRVTLPDSCDSRSVYRDEQQRLANQNERDNVRKAGNEAPEELHPRPRCILGDSSICTLWCINGESYVICGITINVVITYKAGCR